MILPADEIIEKMAQYGGGFAQAFARCWYAADPDNRRRLFTAFPELFEKYEALGLAARARTDGEPT